MWAKTQTQIQSFQVQSLPTTPLIPSTISTAMTPPYTQTFNIYLLVYDTAHRPTGSNSLVVYLGRYGMTAVFVGMNKT